jgi:hypothetical protein
MQEESGGRTEGEGEGRVGMRKNGKREMREKCRGQRGGCRWLQGWHISHIWLCGQIRFGSNDQIIIVELGGALRKHFSIFTNCLCCGVFVSFLISF